MPWAKQILSHSTSAESANPDRLFGKHGQVLPVKRGDVIFHEGQPYRGIYFVSAGSLKWFRLDNEGNECVLKIYTPGEIAGLPPLFDKSPVRKYVATLTAMTDGKVIYWSDENFHSFIRKNPEYLISFNEQLCATIKDLVEQTSSVSLSSVPVRLHDYLAKLGAKTDWVRLPFRKHELATTLNTCPETLSRAFSLLRRDGRIAMENGQYRLISGQHTAKNDNPAGAAGD